MEEVVKQKVLEFANKISWKKPDAKDAVKPEDPEYRILEPIVTEEMAEVGLCLEFRKPQSAEEISKKCGKSLEETEKLLWDLAIAGAAVVNKVEGVDKFWIDLWAPGHMEMIVNNKENIKKYPELGKAFSDYTMKKGGMLAGNVPVGHGAMRVIPIERAIEAETRKASFEEISKILNDNTIFSVADCSCRTSREAMGEGCGHPKEDMCIQVGHAAEYYIRTGRGRQITREEAFEIIRRAEENGLMHSIPNVDGPGKTHAICNCCGCGCFAVRNANMYVNPDIMRSNYVAKVDMEKCVACGMCVENCPSNALKLGQKLCAACPPVIQRDELPYDTEWRQDKWNIEYRTNKKVVLDTGSSPCKAGCPAHIAVQGYIKLASQGRYTEALELIKQENPFPAVCGRICPRFCESECTRNELDESVAVDEIKKFIAEQDLKSSVRYIPRKKYNFNKKVAVIGAGPAGLSCAYFLAIEGYKVTVFEKEKKLGGMLTFGIPSFRLEKDVIEAEIDILKELGVEFKTGVEVGKDIKISDLRNQGYEAFYIAIGAQAGKNLGIDGEKSEGVITGVEFLRRANLGEIDRLYGNVVVIGGGNVAIDVARTAVRLGAKSVELFCLEKREEMPALKEEIEEAEHEGIIFNNSWGPKKILSKDGKVTGVEFKKCLSVFDNSGKFSPKFDEEQVKTVNADYVLIAIGQAIEWKDLVSGTDVEINKNGTIKVDPVTYQTTEKDIFAGGDVATGPKFAIDAIAMGKEGAISIARFLKGHSLVIGRIKREYRSFDKNNINLDGYDQRPRQKVKVDDKEAVKTFKDPRKTFTEEQVKKETERCLSCGTTYVDEFMCIGCGQCVTKCKFDAIKLVKKYDVQTPEFEKLRPTIVKYILKRKVRILLKKPAKYVRKLVSK